MTTLIRYNDENAFHSSMIDNGLNWCDDCLDYHVEGRHKPLWYVFFDGVHEDFREEAVAIRAYSPEYAAKRMIEQDSELWQIAANAKSTFVVSTDPGGLNPFVVILTPNIDFDIQSVDWVALGVPDDNKGDDLPPPIFLRG